ncbi:unnamed protein product [Ectocarpus sp. 6 AP-2014]
MPQLVLPPTGCSDETRTKNARSVAHEKQTLWTVEKNRNNTTASPPAFLARSLVHHARLGTMYMPRKRNTPPQHVITLNNTNTREQLPTNRAMLERHAMRAADNTIVKRRQS